MQYGVFFSLSFIFIGSPFMLPKPVNTFGYSLMMSYFCFFFIGNSTSLHVTLFGSFRVNIFRAFMDGFL